MAYLAVPRTFSSAQPVRHFQFLLPRESRTRAWLDALAVLWTPIRRREIRSLRFFEPLRPESQRRALLASYLVHVSAFYLLIQVPFLTGAWAGELPRRSERIYNFRVVDLSQYVPALKAKGTEGKSGPRRPNEGSPPADTASHPQLKFVSNPARPDNRRQTIIQSAAPPSLLLPFDVHVPNILVGVAQPKLRFPIAAGPAVPRRIRKTVDEVRVAEPRPDFAMNLPDSPNLSPRLPVPPAVPAAGSAGVDSAPPAGLTATGGAAQESILAISVDPSPVSTLVGLPLGNRYGAFSIGDAAGDIVGNGSGTDAAKHGGGSGGPGTSGHGEGGGGNSEAAMAGISISGTGLAVGSGGVLGGAFRPGEIFAVPINPIRLRKNQLVVSTGPMGGGGLPVYGVLQGGRIYTVYFAMPGNSWVMQYCHKGAAEPPKGESPTVVVQMEQSVLAPEPIEKFDFQRPAIPTDKRQALIILRGRLLEDGRIERLEVLQSVVGDADNRALAAARKWKFRPALRGGKAVAVEFLLGIPASGPGSS